MDLLLDYRKDRNNGVSTISNIAEQNGISWGEPGMTDKFLIVPMTVNYADQWKIFSYKYQIDVNKWVFHQVFDAPTTSSGAYLRVAISSNTTTPRVAILNNTTHQVHIYTLDEFEVWQLTQNIDLLYNLGPNFYSERIAADGQYLVVSDWNQSFGMSIGAAYIYQWDATANGYLLVSTIGNPTASPIRYGEGLAIRDEGTSVTIFVGAPEFNGLSGDADGRVYIYNGSGLLWPLLTVLDGENCVKGYFGWHLSAYMTLGTNRLLIGARGYNLASGRVYFYHQLGGIWTLNTTLDAPLAYQGPDNQFGSYVSIWDDQATVSAGDELANQGAVYVHKFDGANWVIDTLTDGINPARFTRAGVTNYGLFACQAPQTVFTIIQNNDAIFLSRSAPGWQDLIFMYHDNLYIKETIDKSFYHLASGNQTVVFKLETPIVGKYRIVLSIDNELETIGPQNDKMYFVENNVYKVASLVHGNYVDGNALAAHVQERMNVTSAGSNTYSVTYIGASNKFVVSAIFPFCFGSNDPNSLKDSCQNKTMGFYDNHNSMIHILYASDIEASLGSPSQIGVNILEAYAAVPVRNNSIFAELGLIANLDILDNKYKIIESDQSSVHFPKKVNQLSFTFPCVDGGALLNINTNNLQVRLFI